jgi:2-polyprenyl-3-methyl-5-hydroxy-6-metoxy-1,4-benzoquinol methylase
MSHPYEVERLVISEIPQGSYTLLDVGIGRGIFGYLLRMQRLTNGYMVGIDIHKNHLSMVKYYRVYDDLILCDARFLPFRNRSFDFIICTEVLEHLKKEDGISLLDKLEHIVIKKIVITTPNGFVPQGPLGGATSEIHRSGWYMRDLKKRGYRVLGLGFRFYKTGKGNWKIWGILHHIFTPLSYVLPQLGEYLIAIKELN